MALRTLSTCAAGEGAEIQWIVTSARRAKSHTIAQEAPDDSEARSCGLVGRIAAVDGQAASCQLLGSPPNGQLPPKNSAAALLAATVVAAGAGGLGAAPGARLYKKAHKSGVDHQTCTFIARYVLFLDRVTRFGQTERDVHEELCIFAVSEVSRYAAQACANG